MFALLENFLIHLIHSDKNRYLCVCVCALEYILGCFIKSRKKMEIVFLTLKLLLSILPFY